MMRTTLLGAPFKRGWTDPIHDADLLLVDLDLLHRLFRSKVRGRGFSWYLAGLPSRVIIPVWPPEASGWRVENQAARGTRVPSGFVALSGLFASAFEALAA